MMDAFEMVLLDSLVSDDVGVSDEFALMGEGFEASPLANMPWKNPREGKCSAENNTCDAWATKKTRNTSRPLCVGHGRKAVDE